MELEMKRGTRTKLDKPWIPTEDAILRELADLKWSFAEVAQVLRRTRFSVGGRARRLGVKFDGRSGGHLRPQDWLEIRPAKTRVQLAYLPHSDFYRVLRQKLKWSGASV